MTEIATAYEVSMVGNPDLPVWTRPIGCQCKQTSPDMCEHWVLSGYVEDENFPTADQLASGFAFDLARYRERNDR